MHRQIYKLFNRTVVSIIVLKLLSLSSNIPMRCVQHLFVHLLMTFRYLDIPQLVVLTIVPSIEIGLNMFFPQCQHMLLRIVVPMRFLARIEQNSQSDHSNRFAKIINKEKNDNKSLIFQENQILFLFWNDHNLLEA